MNDDSRLDCVDANLASCEEKIDKQNKQIQILKDMIIADKMSKFCYCDKCVQARGDIREVRKKVMRELDALIIVKELQNVKSKKNDI